MEPLLIGLVVEHLAADPGIGKILSKAFQGIKIGSRPAVWTINPVNGFADDPANPLVCASSQQPLASTEIACGHADGILHLYPAKISL